LPWNRRPGFSDVAFLEMTPYGLYLLASLTPIDWQVELVNEKKCGIDFEKIGQEASVAAITAITATANRAYEIADELRRRGVKVIMGGSHVSAFPNEALIHSDCVAIGEAELAWPGILRDFEAGRLKEIYYCERPESLDISPVRDLDSWRLRRAPYFAKYLPLKVGYVETTRGCPIGCRHCSVTNFFGRKLRHKSVGFAIDELWRLKRLGMNLLVLLDDNIIGNKDYAREYFTALKKLHLHWFCQTDIRIADADILDLAVESGLVYAFIGFESLSPSVLKSSVSAVKSVWRNEYEYAVAALRDRRVAVEGAFIFGYDGQKRESMREEVQWTIDNKLDLGQFKALTPLPGTPFFGEMDAAGRIITKNWDQYDLRRYVFSPNGSSNWSPAELEAEVDDAYRLFYSPKSIRHRFNRKNHPFPLSGLLRYTVYSTVFHATNMDYYEKLVKV
jgi:radical SAM superfamily enzyme YgiQ (UPF0313 family)